MSLAKVSSSHSSLLLQPMMYFQHHSLIKVLVLVDDFGGFKSSDWMSLLPLSCWSGGCKTKGSLASTGEDASSIFWVTYLFVDFHDDCHLVYQIWSQNKYFLCFFGSLMVNQTIGKKLQKSTVKSTATRIRIDARTLNRNRIWIPPACRVTWIQNFTLYRNRKQDRSTNLAFSDSNSELGSSS
jgi:hypothetical protein